MEKQEPILKTESGDHYNYKISAGFNSHSDLHSLALCKSRVH